MYSYIVYAVYNNNALYICTLCCGTYSIFPSNESVASTGINNHRELNLKLQHISSHCCYPMQVNIMLPFRHIDTDNIDFNSW